MSMEDLRNHRAMPFLKRGMRVEVLTDGRKGRIASANRSMNLNIRIDGESKSRNFHPQWMLRYFDDSGKTIAEYRD